MKNIKTNLFNFLLLATVTLVVISISFQIYMFYLHFTNQDNDIIIIVNEIDRIVDKIRY